MKKTLNLIWQVPIQEYWERDWLIRLLNNFQINEIEDGKNKIVIDDAIIITDGVAKDGIKTRQYISKFRQKHFKVGCFHLSDEEKTYPVDFYQDADFVFRNYFRDEVQKLKNCHFFALGYKSGFCADLKPKKIKERKYFLTFAGQLRGSRQKLFEATKGINGNNFFRWTKGGDDPQGLNISEYARVLNDSVFALCPEGIFSLDTFRVYEALEAGAIPIVQDRDNYFILKRILRTQLFKTRPYKNVWEYWYRVGQEKNYWAKAYGTDFPCPKVYDWHDLKTLISKINIEEAGNKIQAWWLKYKQSLTDLVASTVENAFFK